MNGPLLFLMLLVASVLDALRDVAWLALGS